MRPPGSSCPLERTPPGEAALLGNTGTTYPMGDSRETTPSHTPSNIDTSQPVVTIPRSSAEQLLQQLQEEYAQHPSRRLRISLKSLAHYLAMSPGA
jgi:hypothetical protein